MQRQRDFFQSQQLKFCWWIRPRPSVKGRYRQSFLKRFGRNHFTYSSRHSERFVFWYYVLNRSMRSGEVIECWYVASLLQASCYPSRGGLPNIHSDQPNHYCLYFTQLDLQHTHNTERLGYCKKTLKNTKQRQKHCIKDGLFTTIFNYQRSGIPSAEI